MRQLIRVFLDMPISIRLLGIILAIVFISGAAFIIGIPAVILLIAFPKLWFLIGAIVLLVVIGYKKANK